MICLLIFLWVSSIHSGRKKDAADDVLKDLILRWTRRHPPPANILLVSGDDGFSAILEESRCRGYMVLLASRDVASGSEKLQSSASVIWEWQDFALGKAPKRMDPRLIGSVYGGHVPHALWRNSRTMKTKRIQHPADISTSSRPIDRY